MRVWVGALVLMVHAAFFIWSATSLLPPVFPHRGGNLNTSIASLHRETLRELGAAPRQLLFALRRVDTLRG